MTKLIETNAFTPDIYQIETTDPVLGGPPNLGNKEGIANVQAQQLANRTVFLKALIETLQARLGGLDYVTPAQLSSAVTRAVNDLLDGAPAALNTLKELADEVNDNENAIAALTAQIARKLHASSYTATDILAKLKTVDGAGSNLDADKLDGLQAAAFWQKTERVTQASHLDVLDTRAAARSPADYVEPRVSAEFTDKITAGWHSALTVKGWHHGYAAWQIVGTADTGDFERLYVRFGKGNSWKALRKIWHEGNDGTGSGLDADKLDGLHAADFVRSAQLTSAMNALINGAPGTLDTLKEISDALADDDNAIAALTTSLAGKLNAASYTALDVLAKVQTVDGAGSGLDADLLDGQEGAYYRNAGHLNAGVLPHARLPKATQAEAQVGADNRKAMTALRTKQAIGGWDYASPEVPIAYDGNVSFQHGLGQKPAKVQVDLICKVAELGFQVGDVMLNMASTSAAAYHRGLTIWARGSSTLTLTTNPGGFRVSAANGHESTLTPSRWRYLVKASL